MERKDVLAYVSFAVDDTLSERNVSEAPDIARFVGWQCGFEPLFVAVWSHLNVRLDDDEAEQFAADLLTEKGWWKEPRPADYII